MAITKHQGLCLKAIVNVLPSNVEDNLDLALIAHADERQKLIDHTGIRFRRITQKPVLDLFKIGIEDIFKLVDWSINEMDVLICVTQSPDSNMPSVACKLHGDLNFNQQTLCYDINAGCSGYVYGLQTIAAILATINKPNPKAILCCGDTSSKMLFKNDTATQPIFSDAVSVTAITYNTKEQPNQTYFNLETFGSGQKAIYTEINTLNEKKMRLNGIDVFNYSVKYVPQNINALLMAANISLVEPTAYILHQANKLINDAICKKLTITAEKAPQTLTKYGNTASASIPITLCHLLNLINHNPNWIVLCGFGVGFSVASALIYIPANLPHKLLEI